MRVYKLIMKDHNRGQCTHKNDCLFLRSTMVAMLLLLFVIGPLLSYGQSKAQTKKVETDKPPAKTTAPKQEQKQNVKSQQKPKPESVSPQPVAATLYYPDLDAKQLFQILSGTYQVQFEGIETVTGPVTLISKEKVDLSGMLKLLNEVLAKQNKAAELKGQIVRIVPATGMEDRTISLAHAEAQQVKRLLEERFMKTDGEIGEDTTIRVTFIEVPPQGKAVIVRGHKSLLDEMQDYIAKHLDKPSKEKQAAPAILQKKKEISVKHAEIKEVVAFLRKVYLAPSGAKPEEKTRMASVIEAHPKLPKIIVVAPEDVLTEIEKIVKKELDLPKPKKPKAPMHREYLSLEYISAVEFNYILRNDETLSERGNWLFAPEDFNRPASLLTKLLNASDPISRYIQGEFSEKTQRMLEGYDGSDPPAGPFVTSLVEELNRIIRGGTLFDEKILQHIKLSEEINRLLKQTGLDSSVIRLNRMILEEAFPQELEKIRYKFKTSMAPGNILIVSSHDSSLLKKFTELQKKIDIDRKQLRYIQLSYAKADDVAKMIKAIYPAKVPQLSEGMIGQQPAVDTGEEAVGEESLLLDTDISQFERFGTSEMTIQDRLSRSLALVSAKELTVVPDKQRNYLMIYTYSRNFPKILDLIKELDKPQRQVFIDAYVAQVNLDDSLEFGADIAYEGPGVNIERKGETIPYALGQSFNTANLIGTGLRYDYISNNLKAYFRALQTTQSVDIMARPSILVKNNTKANIFLGRKVPLVDKVDVSITGLTSSKVKYTDIKTELTVTPQIHPDNYISLTISQTVNEVSAETFQISKEFNPQVILMREANTQLRVKDGQTVCLGGFVIDDVTTEEHKVPLLGDIPLLGYLFKMTSNSYTKREMIIFITPHIIETPYDVLRMTNVQRRTTSAEVRKNRHNKEILEPQMNLRTPPFHESPELPEGKNNTDDN